MNELIAIKKSVLGTRYADTVNARDLHAFLESKQDFSTWIKNRIQQYDFVENQDFIRFHKKMEANNATQIDYHLTLDMAKELSMVERNAKGKEARQYFIECERIAKQTLSEMTPEELLLHQAQLLVDIKREQRRQAELQQQLIARQESNERRLDQIETASDHFTIIGWWRYAKQNGSLPLPEAARMGKKATAFCTEHAIDMGDVPDPRFGRTKTYPKWVLDELFIEKQQPELTAVH